MFVFGDNVSESGFGLRNDVLEKKTDKGKALPVTSRGGP
jgi:hypothetical protein